MPSATSDWNLRRHGPKPCRRAMASMATKPILWRLAAYFRPGLPSPTMRSMRQFPSGAGGPGCPLLLLLCGYLGRLRRRSGCRRRLLCGGRNLGRSGRGCRLGCGRHLLLAAAGAGDRRNGEVAISDHRLHIGRKLDVADVDRAADLPAGEVDLDLLRNRVGRAIELDVVAHDVENAAALQARRRLVIGEVDGHGDRDPLAGAKPQEI